MKFCTANLITIIACFCYSGDCQCSFYSDDYAIEWTVKGQGKNTVVNFKLSKTIDRENFWTGIGFGPGMSHGDYSVIKVRNGAVTFLDMWSRRSGEPEVDDRSDLLYLSVAVVDGILRANFSRPISTNTSLQDISLTGCQTFMFPVHSGSVDETTGQLLIHDQIPSKLTFCDIDTRCRRRLRGEKFSVVVPIQRKPQITPKFYQVSPIRPNETLQANPILSAKRQTVSFPRGKEKKQAVDKSITDGRCYFRANNYKAEWKYDPRSKTISINIRARQTKPNADWWTGIGFGKSMTDSDFVVITVVKGQLTISDRTSNKENPHSEPVVDNQVNVQFLKGVIDGSWVDVSFTRPINSTDVLDKSLQDASINQGCQYFMFPTSGGLIYFDGRLGAHSQRPRILLVCQITQCYPGGTQSQIFEKEPAPISLSSANQAKPSKTRCIGEDNALCGPYFVQYLSRVDQFAIRNNLSPQSQYVKACELLRGVQKGIVAEECCTLFTKTCPLPLIP